MNIHEYQAKQILSRYQITTPLGIPALSKEEAFKAVERLQKDNPVVVVKAQIHAGGRGLGGGVRVCKTTKEAQKAIEDIFGMTLVTHQTGPQGKHVQRLLIEEGLDIDHEYYLSLTLNRDKNCVTVMASTEGGMDIETVAEQSPEKIIREDISPITGWSAYQSRNIAFALGLSKSCQKAFIPFMDNLVQCYMDMDCSMLEINPLISTKQDSLVALDCKINFDSNGLFRHPDVVDCRDLAEEEASEIEAGKYDLSYIKLEGTIGCMVNGAGLAMSTMDIIKHHGGSPANFLDVGGSATKEKVTAAFKIITQDPSVKGIFVNIFGGIMKCDTIAEGIVAAVNDIGLNLPLVVRLEGTNVDLGKKHLSDSNLDLVVVSDLTEGATEIVKRTT